MNLFSPAEVIQNYADAGGRKASLPLFRMLALGILAGMLFLCRRFLLFGLLFRHFLHFNPVLAGKQFIHRHTNRFFL